jgi:hypothetical protein
LSALRKPLPPRKRPRGPAGGRRSEPSGKCVT